MAHKNVSQREARVITLLKEIACKVCELDSSHMKMILITRHNTEIGHQVWDAFSHDHTKLPKRELVWRGKNAHKLSKEDKPFVLFSRRPREDGAAQFMISDTKHGESHELAIIFDQNLTVQGVRKGDILGNDFKARVGKQTKELSEILKFDRQIFEVTNGS